MPKKGSLQTAYSGAQAPEGVPEQKGQLSISWGLVQGDLKIHSRAAPEEWNSKGEDSLTRVLSSLKELELASSRGPEVGPGM